MSANLSETLQRFLFIIILVISLFIILTYLLSMGLGILVFFTTSEGLKFSQDTITLYPLLLIDVEVAVNARLYFLFLWGIFFLCFALAWNYRKSFCGKIKESFSSKASFLSNNLLAMPTISSMLLVATIMLHYLQTQSGIPTGEPPQVDPFVDLLRFSRAALVEEIVFRIIPIGAFLVVYTFIVGKNTNLNLSRRQRSKICILSVLQPEKAKAKAGLRTISEKGLRGGMIWGEWMMIGFTAFVFGVAHYSGGRGLGKISQAALSGFVFALAYLYYGVQAPILLHWYFNYYFFVFVLSLEYCFTGANLLSLVWSANFFLGLLVWFVIVLSLITILNRKKT